MVEQLEAMKIGSAVKRDCTVERLETEYQTLKTLEQQWVNIDELDYLAKRLDSFNEGEKVKFQAMAAKLNVIDMQDLINLTFCCGRVTVISDFKDLEKVCKQHLLNINSGGMPLAEYDESNGEAIALQLIQSGAGAVTPYGVVYDNGIELEQSVYRKKFSGIYARRRNITGSTCVRTAARNYIS